MAVPRFAEDPVRQLAMIELLHLVDRVMRRILGRHDGEFFVRGIEIELEARATAILILADGAGIDGHADQLGIKLLEALYTHRANGRIDLDGLVAVRAPGPFHMDVFGEIHARHEDAHYSQ